MRAHSAARRSDLGPLRPFQASVPLHRGPGGRGYAATRRGLGQRRGSLGQPGAPSSHASRHGRARADRAGPGPGLGSRASEGNSNNAPTFFQRTAALGGPRPHRGHTVPVRTMGATLEGCPKATRRAPPLPEARDPSKRGCARPSAPEHEPLAEKDSRSALTRTMATAAQRTELETPRTRARRLNPPTIRPAPRAATAGGPTPTPASRTAPARTAARGLGASRPRLSRGPGGIRLTRHRPAS